MKYVLTTLKDKLQASNLVNSNSILILSKSKEISKIDQDIPKLQIVDHQIQIISNN